MSQKTQNFSPKATVHALAAYALRQHLEQGGSLEIPALNTRIATMYTDRQGRTWHIMEREDSVCVYYTQQGDPAHYVVWNSLDSE